MIGPVTRTGRPRLVVTKAWAELHHVRHRALSGPDTLVTWLAVLELRQLLRGELHPSDWTHLVDSIIAAATGGEPAWPVYARHKRGEPMQVAVRLPDAPVRVAGLPPGSGAIVSALRLALAEIAERKAAGEIP